MTRVVVVIAVVVDDRRQRGVGGGPEADPGPAGAPVECGFAPALEAEHGDVWEKRRNFYVFFEAA